MLSNIFNNILNYWVEWLCIGISTLLCFSYRSLVKKIHDERETNAAMREGMKALLHNKIIEKCEKCIEKGYCSTEEMDEILYLYDPYKALNGNGSAERAIEKVKDLPTQPE